MCNNFSEFNNIGNFETGCNTNQAQNFQGIDQGQNFQGIQGQNGLGFNNCCIRRRCCCRMWRRCCFPWFRRCCRPWWGFGLWW